MEYEGKYDGTPIAVANMESLYRRQSPLGTVKKWWQKGVVTDKWARDRLTLMGFADQSVRNYIDEWQRTLGKNDPGPKPPDTSKPESAGINKAAPQGTVQVPQGTVNVPGSPGSRP